MELARYIHLNPLRAKLVVDLYELDQQTFSGHGAIIGEREQPWQNSERVLLYFGRRVDSARQKYRDFVAQGIDEGGRNDLAGGGLIRSAAGWSAVKELKRSNAPMKSDERILGDDDFVSEILSRSKESFDPRYALKAGGMEMDFFAQRVATLLNMDAEDIWYPGKTKELVRARSLRCFWALRELGMSMAATARRLNLSTVAVSKSVARGAEIAKDEGWS